MRYSKLLGKTVKQEQSGMVSQSHKLLYKAGYIRESTAGRYYFLPLGMLVTNKIIDVIRDEMNKTGAQEILTPVLHPLELWKETNRNNETSFELMTIQDRRGAEFALGGTAEEMVVDLVRKFNISYKDLPFNIYQFSSKFRDELRARGGLLRVREFTMKDAYSFHTNEEDFMKEYKKMWESYYQIFLRLGMETKAVLADNGYIGGDFCHEFIMDADAGESKYLSSEDGTYLAHEDVAEFMREEVNPNEEIKEFKIIDQPEWVKTMEDFSKHYKLPANHCLKNVVYKNITTGDIIIAVIRGDLEVNKTKLEKVLKATGQLEDAKEEDLRDIDSQSGYVHSWGHKHAKGKKVIYVGDISLKSVRNFIGGQKEKDKDSINVNYERDFTCDLLADIALAKEGYLTKEGNQKLTAKKGIEVGNIFQLGCHYSNKMTNATYVDKDGERKPLYMGCYGIGVGRTMAAIVENSHDEKGIIWPKEIAPFKIHLVGLNLEKEEVAKKANALYEELISNGIEVLFDDRSDVTAGEKFSDADLIGIPTRVVISEKTGNKVEIKNRNSSEVTLTDKEELLK